MFSRWRPIGFGLRALPPRSGVVFFPPSRSNLNATLRRRTVPPQRCFRFPDLPFSALHPPPPNQIAKANHLAIKCVTEKDRKLRDSRSYGSGALKNPFVVGDPAAAYHHDLRTDGTRR
jgi:hypothetical protein